MLVTTNVHIYVDLLGLSINIHLAILYQLIFPVLTNLCYDGVNLRVLEYGNGSQTTLR